MSKEEPNTQLFCDNKIARVVFEHVKVDGFIESPRWFPIINPSTIKKEHLPLLHKISVITRYISNIGLLLDLPIETWIIENNFPLNPKDWDESHKTMFKLRFL